MVNHRKQQGAVLLVAIILLLVITIIGVSAVNSSSIKTQIAGNSMFSMLVYQGAESTLAKSASNSNFFYLNEAIHSGTGNYSLLAADLPDENISGGGVLKSSSDISFLASGSCPISRKANSVGSGGITCFTLQIDARSQIQSTNARDSHLEGVALPVKLAF